MKSVIYIPRSAKDAGAQLRRVLARQLENLPKSNFVGAWSPIACFSPGLHPDDLEDTESGWPRVLRSCAAEAWLRSDIGALDDDDLYPFDAHWPGLYDRLNSHTTDETERRRALAAHSVESANA